MKLRDHVITNKSQKSIINVLPLILFVILIIFFIDHSFVLAKDEEISINNATLQQAMTGEDTFISSLIQTIDMSTLSPPSPDPSGLAYLPWTNTLLISDGEVEEIIGGITHFQGANLCPRLG